VEGTNKAHENGEAMGFVGVRLTAQLGRARYFLAIFLVSAWLFDTPIPNPWNSADFFYGFTCRYDKQFVAIHIFEREDTLRKTCWASRLNLVIALLPEVLAIAKAHVPVSAF
jgi:hypothetical protein